VILRPALPTGGDIGVESLGFVPRGFLPNGVAYLADRRSPGAPTEGTDTILRLTADALGQAGVREGDLLVSTESAGRTVAVRCGATCTAIVVAEATPAAHVEGHVTAVPGPAPEPVPSRPRRPWLWLALSGVAAAAILLSGRRSTWPWGGGR